MNMYLVKKNTAFYASLKTLRFFFVYPDLNENSIFNLSSYMSFFLSSLVLIIFILGSSIHVVMSLKANVGADISEDLSVILGGLGMMTNVGMFQHYQQKWSIFFTDVTNFRKFGKPPSFDGTRDRGNLFSAGYVVYCTIGTVIYSFVAILESTCGDSKGEVRHKEICGTLTPVWLPFDDVSLPVKNSIFVVQYCLANYIITSSAVCCFLPFETTELLICHISYLKENFVKVFEVADEHMRVERLRFCINYHTYILRMADQLNFLVKFTLGHMSLICALVFGCIGNQIFKAKPLGAAIFLLGYMVSLFLLCYAGQRIMNESLSLADVIYESHWYRGTAEMKKSLKFVMARCQIPVTLSAWPFGFFSFPLFMMVPIYISLLQNEMIIDIDSSPGLGTNLNVTVPMNITNIFIGYLGVSSWCQIVKTSYSYLTLLRQST